MSQESVTEYSSDEDAAGSDDPDVVSPFIDLEKTNRSNTTLPGSNDSDEHCLPSPNKLAENALSSIEKLHVIAGSLREDSLDENTVQEIQATFIDIFLFIRAGASGQLNLCGENTCIKCIVSVFDFRFLTVLLTVRRKLLEFAYDADPHYSDDVVACCIDYLFACCTDFILNISGSRSDTKKQVHSLPSGFQNQREEESVRAACRLPQTWEQFPGLLRSSHVSPASKRLAVSLLFAVFVIRPDLEICDPWAEAGIEPEIMLDCLQILLEEFIVQARNLTLSSNDPTGRSLRMAYAMTIALFASSEFTIQSRREDVLSVPFQPQTSASLLELLHFILSTPPNPLTLVMRELDDAQSILIYWGAVIPWIWQKWDDPRIIGFDAVVTLTSNWLCHLDKSLSMTLLEESSPESEGKLLSLRVGVASALKRAMASNPQAALIALFHQIRDESSRGNLSNSEQGSNMLRLHRTIWCLAELVEKYVNTLASDDLCLVAQQLIALFAGIDDSAGLAGSIVNSGIVRCLNALRTDIAVKAIFSFHKNIPFFTKIAGTTSKTSRMITGDPGGCFLLEPGTALRLVTLVDFISLVCRCNATKCIPVTTFSLLSDLLKFLSLRMGTPELRVALLSCLVYAHGQCRPTRTGAAGRRNVRETNADAESNQSSTEVKIQKTWDDEDVYNLALNVVGTNLNLAVALASYVPLTIKKSTDPLLAAEAWDYLSDVLLIIVTGRLEECDEDLGGKGYLITGPMTSSESPSERKTLNLVSVTGKMCAALEAVLKRSEVSVARLLLDSPWMISLCDALNRLRKPVQVGTGGPAEETAPNGVGYQEPISSEDNRFDPRVIKTFEGFLQELKKFEEDLGTRT